MKKVLIEENRAKADLLVSEIKEVYLSRVDNLVIRIRALGIKNITKALLLECIAGNFQTLRGQYEEIYKGDLDVFKTPEMRHMVESSFALKLNDVRIAFGDFYSREMADRLPFSLQVLASIFELDENGMPFITEEKEQILREGFKEFIENPELLRVYNLHIEVAQQLQDLMMSIRKTGLDRINAMYTVGGFALLSLFLVGDNIETGNFSVKARRLEYKADPVLAE